MELLDALGFEQSAILDADTDGDGELSTEETLVAIGHYIDDVELDEIMNDHDKDNDGYLNFQEFFEPYGLSASEFGGFGDMGDDFDFDDEDLGDEF